LKRNQRTVEIRRVPHGSKDPKRKRDANDKKYIELNNSVTTSIEIQVQNDRLARVIKNYETDYERIKK